MIYRGIVILVPRSTRALQVRMEINVETRHQKFRKSEDLKKGAAFAATVRHRPPKIGYQRTVGQAHSEYPVQHLLPVPGGVIVATRSVDGSGGWGVVAVPVRGSMAWLVIIPRARAVVVVPSAVRGGVPRNALVRTWWRPVNSRHGYLLLTRVRPRAGVRK